MTTTARTTRLVLDLAVTAVCVAAMAAALSNWMAKRDVPDRAAGAPAHQQQQVNAQRPRSDAPARVVRAPQVRAASAERTL
jgi:hypothetical protein